MRKNARIIQISGLRGLAFVVFVVTCLIMGFIGFPGLVAMCIWNMASSFFGILPQINIFQGVLLWVIIALSIYMLSGGNQGFVALKRPSQLSESEIKDLMQRIKTQNQVNKINSMILKSDKFKEISKATNKDFEESECKNDKEKL